jgi:hypothetical protein
MVGASVAEWLKSLTLNNVSLTAVDSNPDRDFGFLHVRNTSLRNVGGSTQVSEIMNGREHEVFLHQ